MAFRPYSRLFRKVLLNTEPWPVGTIGKMSSMTAAQWSNYNKKFNSPSGQAMTYSMIQGAFEKLWFKAMKESLSKKSSGAPLDILVLAGGTGAEVEVICSQFDAKQVSILATDYAEGMVEATKETIERIGAQDRVRVQVMDAMKIDKEDDTFDVVTLILGPMLMPDPSQVFREITRVLRPGGWSAYLTPGKMETHDVLNESKRKWGSPEALSSKLKDAGFSSIVSELVESKLSVDRGEGIDQMLDLLFQNPGMAIMYEGNLSADEVKQFRSLARDQLHSNWPQVQPALPASIYLSANAAMAHKVA